MSTADTQHATTALKYAVAGAWLGVTALGSAWWLRPGPVSQRWAVGALFMLARRSDELPDTKVELRDTNSDHPAGLLPN